jgi:prepilin-type N-terminal cleavage/methylation domain-containing protein
MIASHPRPRRGFTMIEMLVVFVVFGAVMLVSVRRVGDTLRRDRTAKVAAIVGSDVEQAFAIAARQRVPVRMKFSRVNKTFQIVDRNTPTLIYKKRSFATSGEYGLDSIQSNHDNIDIMPNGLATDSLHLDLFVKTTGGAWYTKTVYASKGGLVKVAGR